MADDLEPIRLPGRLSSRTSPSILRAINFGGCQRLHRVVTLNVDVPAGTNCVSAVPISTHLSIGGRSETTNSKIDEGQLR
jgi:hypothetical protein